MASPVPFDDCPIPGLASVLQPYLRPRSEAAAIRRHLQAYLQKKLSVDDGPVLSATHLVSSIKKPLSDPPAGLTGIRRAFWKAIKANQEAKARHAALKADCDDLTASMTQTRRDVIDGQEAVTRAYVPLLREREHRRRVRVLDQAFEAVVKGEHGRAAGQSPGLDELIQRALGEAPVPPSRPLPNVSRSVDVEGKVLELKKALVSAQRRVKALEFEKAEMQSFRAKEFSTIAQVAGLQSALQELTAWMEDQLSTITAAEAAAETPSNDSESPLSAPSIATRADLEALYTTYIHARHHLLTSLTNPPSLPVPPAPSNLFPQPTSPSSPTPSTPTLSLLALPHLPQLLKHTHALHSTQTASTFLRRTLASQDAATEALIQRLAGESRMVGAGAAGAADWETAGSAAVAAEEEALTIILREGLEATREATEVVESLEKLRSQVENVERPAVDSK